MAKSKEQVNQRSKSIMSNVLDRDTFYYPIYKEPTPEQIFEINTSEEKKSLRLRKHDRVRKCE